MSRFFKLKKLKLSPKGFSLVELIVTIGIVSVILTIIVSNQSKYADIAALGNLADEIGLTLSQAQSYGIAVRELSPGSDDFSAAYGLSMSLLPSGSNTSYLFFADRNANHAYDGDWTCATGGASECLDKKQILRGHYIDTICVVPTSGAEECSGIGRVDMSFVRPHTEAQIVFFDTSGSLYTPSSLKGAHVTFKSPTGISRSVVVYQSGQISVQ